MQEKTSIDELRKILQFYAKGYKVPPIIKNTLFAVAKAEVEDKKKMVLIQRDPNIERNRIQSSYVRVIDGDTIELNPAIVSGFGADFDGDTMGVFALLTEESQKEAEKMLSVTRGDSLNNPNMALSKEALTGLFALTFRTNDKPPVKIDSVEEAEKLDIADAVIYKGYTTTAGRVIFNSIVPEYIGYLKNPFIYTGKTGGKLARELIVTSQRDFVLFIDAAMKMGFKYATMYPDTISLDMLTLSPELIKMKKQLDQEKDLAKQDKLLNEMTKVMVEHIRVNEPGLYEYIMSGAAKGTDQIRQVMVAKGLTVDSNGQILSPISKSMNEGYNPEEYFAASHGSRKGIIDRAYNTASGGYTYRTAIYAVGNVTADINNGNCGTKRTLRLKLTPEIFSRMAGRYVQDGDNIKPISKDMIGTFINLRSPIFCKTEKICRTCYGDLIKQLDSRNIGIISCNVLSLSEKIMKSSDGLIEKDGKLIAMGDMWEKTPNEEYDRNV